MDIVTRFAPSPTGFLHLGHAFAAFNAWRRAREAGGRFLLRIEDIDPVRCRPAYAQAIQEDLEWLGLNWDRPVRFQSEHLPDYRAVVMSLANRGLAYPCFCTRADIAASASAAHGPDGSVVYPGTCRVISELERQDRISSGEAHAWRLDLRAAATGPLWYYEGDRLIACQPDRFGDIVLARKDVPASYHLCVTNDDAVQGVSLVTRGADLQPATDIQRVLQTVMGWPQPRYAHHALLVDASGRRLAKRDKAMTLRSLRADGISAVEVLRRIGQSQ